MVGPEWLTPCLVVLYGAFGGQNPARGTVIHLELPHTVGGMMPTNDTLKQRIMFGTELRQLLKTCVSALYPVLCNGFVQYIYFNDERYTIFGLSSMKNIK